MGAEKEFISGNNKTGSRFDVISILEADLNHNQGDFMVAFRFGGNKINGESEDFFG